MKCKHVVYAALFILGTCAPAGAREFMIAGDTAGSAARYEVRSGDTLYDIARKHDVGILALRAANPGVDTWLPPEGRELVLPTGHILPPGLREGIVINIAELRLYYFSGDGQMLTFPVGLGKEGWPTPLGKTKIVRKKAGPDWIPPASIRAETPDLPDVVPDGPDNPLGTHALYLGWPGYLIHGTNTPYGVGRRSSHGCIRLYPEDIPVLFARTDVGTSVTIIDAPYKTGWRGDELMLEVAPGAAPPQDDVLEAVRRAAGAGIDAAAVLRALERRDGLPVAVARKATYNR